MTESICTSVYISQKSSNFTNGLVIVELKTMSRFDPFAETDETPKRFPEVTLVTLVKEANPTLTEKALLLTPFAVESKPDTLSVCFLFCVDCDVAGRT